MIVGITGTRKGMTLLQYEALEEFLHELRPTELHHGDCLGADAQADIIARGLKIRVFIHPPTNPTMRAFCGKEGDMIAVPKPYIVRNHCIVDTCTDLIALPREGFGETRRKQSGTWATVGYAKKRGGKKIWIIYPDGSRREEESVSRSSGEAASAVC